MFAQSVLVYSVNAPVAPGETHDPFTSTCIIPSSRNVCPLGKLRESLTAFKRLFALPSLVWANRWAICILPSCQEPPESPQTLTV